MSVVKANLEVLPGRLKVALLIAAAVLVALPFADNDFYTQMVARMMVMAIFAMSFDLLQGVTGLVSQGHAAFFGMGGYALAFLTASVDSVSLWWSLPLVAVSMAALAALIGGLVIRTTGIYFIMVTLAISQMIFHVFFDNKALGGSDGLYINIRPTSSLFGWVPFDLESRTTIYYLVLVVMLLVYVFLRRLLWSPFGRALAGIRVNEHRMKAIGFNTARYKLAAFTLGGGLAGIAGYLYGALNGMVSPELIGFHMSALVLMMVVLGGSGNFAGAIVGAFAFELMLFAFKSAPQVGSVSLDKYWQLWMGLSIVLLISFAPRGVLGIVESLVHRWRQRGRRVAVPQAAAVPGLAERSNG